MGVQFYKGMLEYIELSSFFFDPTFHCYKIRNLSSWAFNKRIVMFPLIVSIKT